MPHLTRIFSVFATGLLCLFLSGGPASAKSAGAKNVTPKNVTRAASEKADADLAKASITAAAARTLATDYRLTGHKALAAGVQKKLLRGKPLPAGLAKKAVNGPMTSRLPAHSGYSWISAGQDLVLIKDSKTPVVADVLHGVFR